MRKRLVPPKKLTNYPTNMNNDLFLKAKAVEADVTSFVAGIETFEVVDDNTESEAAKLLGSVKIRTKRIKELKSFFTDPLKEQVKNINTMFDSQLDPLLAAEGKIKTSLSAYFSKKEAEAKNRIEEELKKQAEEKKRLEEEHRKALEEAAKNNQPAPEPPKVPTAMEAVATVEAPKTTVKTSTGSTSFRKIWKWEVEDMTALIAARPDLFIVDAAKVTALVRSGERELPGVRIFQEVSASTRI